MCLEVVKRLKKYYENLCFDPNKGYLFKNLSFKNKQDIIDTPYSLNIISKEFKNLRDTLSITCPIGTGSLKKRWYHIVFGSYTDDDIEKVYDRNFIY